MNQDEIANFKLMIWNTLMNTEAAFDPIAAAQRADVIYEQFYLGKQANLAPTKRAKKR